jgi:hypothetical protein
MRQSTQTGALKREYLLLEHGVPLISPGNSGFGDDGGQQQLQQQ